jgi:thioredoxin
VQAIWKDMQEVASFSVSGALRPGKVSDISGEQLDEEMTSHETPILLDVYATWCGPCKMMAPEMEKVAEELGSKCRVAKLDSDHHPEWAGRYKIQGLPTTLLIHKGQVQGRLEGAFMKDKLLELAQQHI